MAQRQGRDLEAMKQQGESDDAQPSRFSAFTAINSPRSGQPVTPQPSADIASVSTIAPQPTAQRSRRKARNPAVARYLGIGTATAPSLLDSSFHSSSAPKPLDAPPESGQEPSVQLIGNNKAAKPKPKKASKKQRQVSDRPQVQTYAVQQIATPRDTPKAHAPETQHLLFPEVLSLASGIKNSPGIITPASTQKQKRPGTFGASKTGGRQTFQDEVVWPVADERPSKRVRTASPPRNSRMQKHLPVDSHEAPPSAQGEPDITSSTANNSVKPVAALQVNKEPTFNVLQQTGDVFDEDSDGLFSSPELDKWILNESTSLPSVEHAYQLPQQHEPHLSENPWDDDLEDDDLLSLTTTLINHANGDANNNHDRSSPSTMLESSPALDWPDVNSSSDQLTSSLSVAAFVSPVTERTRNDTSTARGLTQQSNEPIVRSSFPPPARDRSPIIGLASTTLLRTCFRIGEAIKTGSSAIKHGKNVLIELYARVLSSERDNMKQYFVLCDLYHKKPPYIDASFDASIWKSVELFNYDSGRLLQEGRICRCIGKMKRNGKVMELVVLNIWEATWEDIMWVEGIVNS